MSIEQYISFIKLAKDKKSLQQLIIQSEYDEDMGHEERNRLSLYVKDKENELEAA